MKASKTKSRPSRPKARPNDERPAPAVPGRRKHEESPRFSEELFRRLVDGVRDYAIIRLDAEGCIRSWNVGAERIYGYRMEDIVGKSVSVFYPDEDVVAGKPGRELILARDEGRFEDEGERIRGDGKKFWANVVVTPIFDESGALAGFSKVTRDITEKRRAEEALEELAGQLIKLQDEERRRVAGELHDSTSPALTTLIGKLYTLKQRVKTMDEETVSLVEESLTIAESTASMIRTISTSLHPSLLDERGLAASLRWHVSGFTSRTGLQVEMDFPEMLRRYPRDVEIVLFRVVQESLASFLRDGPAGKLGVRLAAEPSFLSLEIRNEAVGAAKRHRPRAQKVPASTAGLSGMRQRIRQLGGQLEIRSSESGTWVKATLPIGDE